MASRPSILVVSQPNTATHNQIVYVRLGELGWDVTLVVPARWRDQYSDGYYTPAPVEGFTGRFIRMRVINPGPVQRHCYATLPSRWLRRLRPDVVFCEQEPFSLSGLQWGAACERAGIPWGLQGDENLDRPFPWPAKVIRAVTIRHARFFAARSPTAADMLRRWGARAPIAVVAHTIPEWDLPPREPGARFTIGYAGRLIEEKGVGDLLAACRQLGVDHRLLVVGDGPMRDAVAGADLGPHGTVEVRSGLLTDGMIGAYREMDLLVLPSRTTATWAEQFGKVLCEAPLCGVPVLGSSSGEIPWVIETTGAGEVFPEGDVAGLAAAITALHDDPARRAELAARGRLGVLEHFAPAVAARELDRLIRSVWPQDGRYPPGGLQDPPPVMIANDPQLNSSPEDGPAAAQLPSTSWSAEASQPPSTSWTVVSPATSQQPATPDRPTASWVALDAELAATPVSAASPGRRRRRRRPLVIGAAGLVLAAGATAGVVVATGDGGTPAPSAAAERDLQPAGSPAANATPKATPSAPPHEAARRGTEAGRRAAALQAGRAAGRSSALRKVVRRHRQQAAAGASSPTPAPAVSLPPAIVPHVTAPQVSLPAATPPTAPGSGGFPNASGGSSPKRSDPPGRVSPGSGNG